MKTNLKGGGFWNLWTNPDEIFILEEFGEEARWEQRQQGSLMKRNKTHVFLNRKEKL